MDCVPTILQRMDAGPEPQAENPKSPNLGSLQSGDSPGGISKAGFCIAKQSRKRFPHSRAGSVTSVVYSRIGASQTNGASVEQETRVS